MLKFKNFFVLALCALLLISTPVFANDTDIMPISESVDNTIEATSVEENTSNEINDDLYISQTDDYSLSDIVYGNVFISSKNFTLNSRNNGGVIFGNLFASTTNTTIKSDLVYSDSKDKNGNYIIDKVNSSCKINGNVYVIATDTFTIESECEINGDLYVFADTVNIHSNAVIKGNIFAFVNSTINLDGKVNGSVYVTTTNYNMNYSGYIAKDLVLSSTGKANISGRIDRNTKISSTGKIYTSPDFITYKDLYIQADDCEFSGEVQGNAVINAKNLAFKNTLNNSTITCKVHGNLEYSSKNDINIPENIVVGEISAKEYIDTNSTSYKIFNKIISFVSLLIYVFLVSLAAKHIAPNYIEKLSKLSMSNVFASLGIGFISIFVVFALFIALLTLVFTVSLSFVLLLFYLFIAIIAMPIFTFVIANKWKLKLNLYLKLLIITAIIFVISLIPTVGASFIFLFVLTSIGKLLMGIFKK